MTPKPLKILIVTHSPVLPSGMAEITRLIFDSLVQEYPAKYELHQIGLQHFHAVATANWPVYPTKTVNLPNGNQVLDRADAHGEDTFRSLVSKIEPDIVFGFNDPQHLEHLCEEATSRKHKLILYVNFDGLPVPPTFHRLFMADRLVATTEFGKRAFLSSHSREHPKEVDVIYPPSDTARFRPLPKGERTQLRRDLLPDWIPEDAFILGWVGLNQWRKQNWAIYQTIHLLRTGDYFVCDRCDRASLPNPNGFSVFGSSGN